MGSGVISVREGAYFRDTFLGSLFQRVFSRSPLWGGAYFRGGNSPEGFF